MFSVKRSGEAGLPQAAGSVVDVLAGGVGGGQGVAEADGGDDGLVFFVHLAGEVLAPRLVGAGDARGRLQVLADEFQGPDEVGIAGGLGDGAMEGHVGPYPVMAVGDLFVDGGQGLVDGHQIGLAAVDGGFGGDLGLDGAAQVQQVEDAAGQAGLVGVDAQRADAGVGRDEDAATLLGLQHAFVLQPRDGLAHHGAADTEGFGQQGFAGNLAAGGEDAGFDLVQQLLSDAVAQHIGGNLGEHGDLLMWL